MKKVWLSGLAFSLATALTCFQNCSAKSFSGRADGSNSGNAVSGGGESPLSYIGDESGGSVFQVGGDGTGRIIVQPPNPFSTTNCTIGYPMASNNPATSVTFSESEVLAGYSPQGSAVVTPGLTVSAFYTDEHAMTLGVRQVVIKSAGGSATTNYAVSALPAVPGMLINPEVGSKLASSDQAGTDASSCPGVPYVCARPVWPALFITDITADPANRSGDWQSGGAGMPPHAIFGTWKSAVRTVDNTKSPATVTVTVTPDTDPAQNGLNLGGIKVPAGFTSAGYSTMVSWEISRLGLQSGHSYRLEFMVHDGDQNKGGGDAGENCVNIHVP